MPSPLTPRPGYTVTVSQIVGGPPTVSASCQRCHDFDISEVVDPGSSSAQLAARLVFLVDDAIHHVSSHITDGG